MTEMPPDRPAALPRVRFRMAGRRTTSRRGAVAIGSSPDITDIDRRTVYSSSLCIKVVAPSRPSGKRA
jgi:hypothetical protein